jgi:hypothetical protein
VEYILQRTCFVVWGFCFVVVVVCNEERGLRGGGNERTKKLVSAKEGQPCIGRPHFDHFV